MSGNKLSIPPVDLKIIELVKPNMSSGPWIAGGSVIQWYKGNPVEEHDIDVFFRDREQYEHVKLRLLNDLDPENILDVNCELIFKSTNAETFRYKKHTVQLIRARFYNSVTELLDKFDIIACKIATDGYSWFSNHHETETHINKNILDMEHIVPDSALKRLFKYWVYGFQPTEELICRIENMQNLNTDFSNTTDYDS